MKNPEEIIYNQISLQTVYFYPSEITEDLSELWDELHFYNIETVMLDEDVEIKAHDHSLILAGTKKSLDDFSKKWLRSYAESNNGAEGKIASVGFNSASDQVDIYVEELSSIDAQFLDRIEKRASGLPWTVAITERCILREQTLEDLDDLYEMYQAPGFTEYIEPLYERSKEEEYTKNYIDKFYRFYGFGLWIVTDRENDAFIGRCGFGFRTVRPIGAEGELQDETDFFDIGYTISVPYQKRGFATEVCEKLIEYARDNLEMDELSTFIYIGNDVSIHLAEKLGFVYAQDVMEDGIRMHRYRIKL